MIPTRSHIFFRGDADVIAKLSEYMLEHGRVYLSVITYYEVLNGLFFKDAKNQLAKFERFLDLHEVLPLTTDIAKRSAVIYSELRKKGQTVDHNDVLIAGTALTSDLTIVTNNERHFSRISGLSIDNWSKE